MSNPDSTPTSTYSTPNSTPDPYDSPADASPSANTYPISRISTDNLPRGLPLLGPLTGYTPTHLQKVIHSRYHSLSDAVRRPLSEKERTAVSYHTAKGLAIASYGPSLGIAAAFYRIRATREEFRWPFYGKLLSEEAGKGFWDGEHIRIGGKEVLKNVPTNAKAALLHASRGTAYVALGMVFVPALVSAYGSTVSAVGELRDERTAQLTRDLRANANTELKERMERRGESRIEAVGRATGQGQRDAGSLFRERSEALQRGKQQKSRDDDDMSPTGGLGGMLDNDYGVDEEAGRLSGAGDMGGVLSDGQMRTREVQAQPKPGKSPTGSTASTFQIEKVERQPQNFAEDYDDASPTGGSGVGSDAGSGSVWERIRQQQGSGSASSSSSYSSSPLSRSSTSTRAVERERREGSTTGDSFAFSSSEEERSYAKDEAQKEFDARIERERKGGDFSEGRGGRWR